MADAQSGRSSGSLTSLLGTIFERASSSSSSSSAEDPAAGLLSLIQVARARIASLGLVSANDTLEDLPTASLRALALDSVYAEAVLRTRTAVGDFGARQAVLQQSLVAARTYLARLATLGVLLRDRSSSSSSSSEADGDAVPAYVNQLSAVVARCIDGDEATAPFPSEAAARRQAKIAALRLERALSRALDSYRLALRAKRGPAASSSSSSSQQPPETAFDLLVLPPSRRGQQATSAEDEDEGRAEYEGVSKSEDGDEDGDGEEDGDEEEEDDGNFVGGAGEEFGDGVRTPAGLRSYLVMLLRLHAIRALNHIDSTLAELALLKNMPASAARDAAARAGQERDMRAQRQGQGQGSSGDDDWRIEQRFGASSSAPLLDPKGKPLRPFTILPSGSASSSSAAAAGAGQGGVLNERQRLRDEVFRPSHRLPTMSIDDYLAEEQRRGNIIQGGGEASAQAPTSTEQRRARAEGDGGATTRDADEAADEQRRRDMEWDDFTEANPRGQGNTMNRG
ncbi:TAP42-domain-containing protein [Acaromyces ingoldii]|uniref:TAP42-domain-containing protein n=1 Tax=Acaromyces ingoldii TaxID=215250 RepID=A0A316YKU4_9BASI|nr:TAP42-domain-containing protein [Acaromyces ingoldii]PWN89696.1 TAP42-domain-containing protein [Acaromyces ingoldii]